MGRDSNHRYGLLRKSTVYGLNGHRAHFVIASSLVTYEHATGEITQIYRTFLVNLRMFLRTLKQLHPLEVDAAELDLRCSKDSRTLVEADPYRQAPDCAEPRNAMISQFAACQRPSGRAGSQIASGCGQVVSRRSEILPVLIRVRSSRSSINLASSCKSRFRISKSERTFSDRSGYCRFVATTARSASGAGVTAFVAIFRLLGTAGLSKRLFTSPHGGL